MIDLFGLGKNQDSPEPEPSSGAPAPEPAPEPTPRSSHKLWAFLLVLDAVFVIVFAGAVAAKVYEHWKMPVAAAVARARRPISRPIKEPAKTAGTPAASTVPAAVAPTQAPAPAPRPTERYREEVPATAVPMSAIPTPRAVGMRPPKPSLLSDAPKHRETPHLAAAADPAIGKVKALRVEFQLHAPKARSVDLLGAFIVRGGRREMTRQDDGTWTLALYLNPGQYRYFFSVDKKRQLDPENPHSEKGASLLTVP